MWKILKILLVTSIFLSITIGCSNIEEKATTSNIGTDKNNIKPITFRMYISEMNADADNFESPVAKEIQKQTGVKLDIEYAVSSAGGKEKLSLMVASGDYPDFVFGKGDLGILKDVNALQKLDGLIEQYGENIKKFYGNQIKRLRWSKGDSGIYYIGGKELVDENIEPTTGFQLQHAVVKDLGFPKMKTLQDFENAIKKYKQKYPMIDGQRTIGLSLLGDDWRFMITVTNPACFATGGTDDGEWFIDQGSNQLIRHVLRPEEREYFRWLNHMNAIGLLDPESFTQKSDQYFVKIASGRVIALADARWGFKGAQTALMQSGKPERTYGYYPLTLKEETKYAEYMSSGYLAGWGIGITSQCKDTVKAIKFLDWMCTEKSQILRHWGIEGVHYKIQNGKRALMPEIVAMKQKNPLFSKITGIGCYLYPFPSYGNRVQDSEGQYFSPDDSIDAIIANQTPIEKEVLKAYDIKTWKDLYPKSTEFPVRPYGAAWLIEIEDNEIKAINSKILQLGYKMLAIAILETPKNFDKAFDQYINAVKAVGVDRVTAAYEKAIKDRIEIWK